MGPLGWILATSPALEGRSPITKKETPHCWALASPGRSAGNMQLPGHAGYQPPGHRALVHWSRSRA